MALISRVKMTGYAPTAAHLEEAFERVSGVIASEVGRQTVIVEQVIQLNRNEPPTSEFVYEGRRTIAVDISDLPQPAHPEALDARIAGA